MKVARVFCRILAVMALLLVCGPTYGQGAADSLMRLLRSGKLPEARLPAVIELVARRGDAADLTYLFEQTLMPQGYTGAAQLAALNGLSDAAENRKLLPTGDLTRLESLFAVEEPQMRAAALRLAGRWKVPKLADPLAAIARDPMATPQDQAAALDALAAFGDAGRKTIEALAGPGHPAALRSRAVGALAGIDLNAAATAAAMVLAQSQPTDDPAPLIGAFLDRQGGPEALAQSLAAVTLPPEVAGAALRSMYSVGRSDAALSAALGKAAGLAMEDKPVTPEEIKAYAAAALTDGDAARGELVFRRKDLSCLKCHAVSGAGGNIGPDLSPVGASSPADYLVASILLPDQAVKEAFETQVVVTIQGRVLTGIVADENENRLVLRTADGAEKSVPKADIDLREKGSSLMPQGLIKFMTRQEFLDLTRFLSELGKPGTPYAVRSSATVQRWRVLKDVPPELVGTVPEEAVFNAAVPPQESGAWQAVYSLVGGTLPLAELTAGGKQPVYLAMEIDVTAAGSVGLAFDSIAGLDVWLAGDHLDTLSPAFATELPPGRHLVILRVDPTQRPAAELAMRLFLPDGSTARAEPLGGT